MCDTSDYAVGVVLGKRRDKKPFIIRYASKTLNSTQINYSITEKELLAVVCALDKFRSYLISSPIVCFINHAALKYQLSKKEAKPRLIQWIPLFLEFTIIIKDKKGVKNIFTDHLSRLTFEDRTTSTTPIQDSFLDEQLLAITALP